MRFGSLVSRLSFLLMLLSGSVFLITVEYAVADCQTSLVRETAENSPDLKSVLLKRLFSLNEFSLVVFGVKPVGEITLTEAEAQVLAKAIESGEIPNQGVRFVFGTPIKTFVHNDTESTPNNTVGITWPVELRVFNTGAITKILQDKAKVDFLREKEWNLENAQSVITQFPNRDNAFAGIFYGFPLQEIRTFSANGRKHNRHGTDIYLDERDQRIHIRKFNLRLQTFHPLINSNFYKQIWGFARFQKRVTPEIRELATRTQELNDLLVALRAEERDPLEMLIEQDKKALQKSK